MTIPEIRARLLEIAAHMRRNPTLANTHAAELVELAEATNRKKPVRRAPVKLYMTEELRLDIRSYAGHFPEASYQDIANALGTNAGRVSEVLAA